MVFGFGDGVNTSLGIVSGVGGAAVDGGAVAAGFISSSTAIGMAIGLSLTSSFIVGAIKSRMAEKNWVRGGIEMAGLGTGVALVGYGIGSELNIVGIVNVHGG